MFVRVSSRVVSIAVAAAVMFVLREEGASSSTGLIGTLKTNSTFILRNFAIFISIRAAYFFVQAKDAGKFAFVGLGPK